MEALLLRDLGRYDDAELRDEGEGTGERPVAETLVGEPETIWAFLGSSRLAAPIGAHRPELVLHGYAHRGSFAGPLGPCPCGTS